jgi:glutamate-1-semialdehyde 2,1-aminomutase
MSPTPTSFRASGWPRPVADFARERVARLTDGELVRFRDGHRRSLELHGQAGAHMPLGVPMPWMLAWPGPCPVYVERAAGATVTDVDGNAYADFCLGDTGAMTGHSPPAAVSRVRERLGDGLTFMLPTEDGIAVSRELTRRFGLERWQFTLTATDANRHALRYARLLTGRPRILIFDRSYHGTVDECFATLADGQVVAREGSLGPPVPPAQTTRVVQFNDLGALERELAHGDVACVLTEPALTNIGVVLPEPGFHESLRALTRAAGTLLILDETHTISAGPGGWTARHGLEPDLLVIGKPIGSGIPSAALGMTAELDGRLRARVDPARAGMAGVGGTLAANALSLAAIRVTLEEVLTDAAFLRMDALGERLAHGVRSVIDRHVLPWHVVRIGGRVEYHFAPARLRNGAEGAALIDREVSTYLHLFALNRGVMVFPFHNRALVCAAHADADVDRHTAVLDAAVDELLAG